MKKGWSLTLKIVLVVFGLAGLYIFLRILMPNLAIKNTNIEEIKDSVVMIQTFDDSGELLATGSGFCAYEKNYIVTNFHVIEGAHSIEVTTDNREVTNVRKIIIFNKKDDLALLEIDGSLDELAFGDVKDLQVKSEITTIGSPKGELNTVSEGIVSNLDEKNTIRISAPISHGSSGGVLLNSKNEVVGITNAGYDDAENLNFAISVQVLDKMYSAYKKGKYDIITQENYKDCCPNIVNYNTTNQLSIKKKASFSSYYNYTVDSFDTFYKATNEYQIFNTAMYEIGINGFNVNYKLLNEKQQKKAAENYSVLLEYETYDEDKLMVEKRDVDIMSLSIEQFIMEVDVLETYALAIFMVELDEQLVSAENLVGYLNNIGMEYENKIILHKLLNPTDNSYNNEIIDSVSNLYGFSYEQKLDIVRYLGMDVDADGNVYW